MFGQHASPHTDIDAEYTSAGTSAAHRLPGQPILGIGAEVTLYAVVEVWRGVGAYVPTTSRAYVVAVEDIPDGVYEIWQVCEAHGTHKVYAQWEGDGDPLPHLLYLADVLDDDDVIVRGEE